MARAPFLIGIDLGTTNSAVAYVDRRQPGPGVRLFLVPQLVAPHEVQPRRVLPSFLYLGDRAELDSGALALPWDKRPSAVAGVLARDRGALAPARQVSSAKSWLAHPGVDRRAPLLPWCAEPGDRQLSPVQASARVLQHLRDAWNATMAAEDEALRFERQRIVLTVPASFDEEARELTVEAAREVGLERLTLLEEPLAAFYAWLAEHAAPDAVSPSHASDTPGAGGAADLRDGQIALVCDVGGGTTDFSLIRVAVEDGQPRFERVAIGEHLLLGGDNLDLALAALVEEKLLAGRPGARLTLLQRHALARQAADAKERLLGEDPPERVRITLLGAGRAVVGGAQAMDLDRGEVLRALFDGFLPTVEAAARPAARDRHAGLKELGLPYESDPAITRHLAAFLARSSLTVPGAGSTEGSGATPAPGAAPAGSRMVRPDLVLFNGGFFTPAAAREALGDALERWFGVRPAVLATNDLAAAVAVGAAHYARLKAASDRRAMVRAGAARAYYVGVRLPTGPGPSGAAGAPQAVCVLARGTEEGTTSRLEREFSVTTNRPIGFTLYSSLTRSDPVGALVPVGEDDAFHEHAPLATVLRYGRKSRHVELPVGLSASFTEVGTLELWCESRVSEHRWRLQFQLRGIDQPPGEEEDPGEPGEAEETTAAAAVVPDEGLAQAARLIHSVFSDAGATGDLTPETLVAALEALFGFGKTAWPIAAIRPLADVLIECAEGRRRSARHEARWLNLFGFCLRPGFGAAKDPWRVDHARGVYAGGLVFASDVQCRVEWLILWQRVAGGFNAAQQRELVQRLLPDLGLSGKKAPRLNPQGERETWRLAASLERLDAGLRSRIGQALLGRLKRDARNASFYWSLARLGARIPLYGPLNGVVAPATAEVWTKALLDVKVPAPEWAQAIVQIAGMTGDALRDVSAETRRAAATRLSEAGFADQVAALARPMRITSADASRVFGEALPEGLTILDGGGAGLQTKGPQES